MPSKHSSWWRRTEDVFKTSSRRLQCNIFLSSKTFWRRLEEMIARRLANTPVMMFSLLFRTYDASLITVKATLKVIQAMQLFSYSGINFLFYFGFGLATKDNHVAFGLTWDFHKSLVALTCKFCQLWALTCEFYVAFGPPHMNFLWN